MQAVLYPVKGRQDGRQVLGGCHQIDIVGTGILQFQEDFGQPLLCDLLSKAYTAYGIILAETAAERTARKKYSAAAVGAADTWLFPMVQGSSCGRQPVGTLTVTFTQMTVCMAVPWAE